MVDMNDLEEKLKEVIRTNGKLDPDKLARATVWLAVFLTQSVPAETFEVRRKNGEFRAYLDGREVAAGSVMPAGLVGHA